MANIISYGPYNMDRLNSEMRNRLNVNSAELRCGSDAAQTPLRRRSFFSRSEKSFEACHIEKDNAYLTIKVHVMIK